MSKDPQNPYDSFEIQFEEQPYGAGQAAPPHAAVPTRTPPPGSIVPPQGVPYQGFPTSAYPQQAAPAGYGMQVDPTGQTMGGAGAAYVGPGGHGDAPYTPPGAPGFAPPGAAGYAPPGMPGGGGGISQSAQTYAEVTPGHGRSPMGGGGGPMPVSQGSPTMAEAGGGSSRQQTPGTDSLGASTKPHALIGMTIDRYKILKLLGEGGFGAVYKAEHTLMKREVAFKTLHKDLAKDPAILHRFKKEGQVASRFKHKNAIELYDFGQMHDGTFFMAMEFLTGEDLRDIIKKKGSLELGPTFDIMIQSLSALAAAHEGGIIHRDLKPDNIKLEDRDGRKDFVKILDFGIAKMKEIAGEEQASSGYKTIQGAFFGTPEYGSPEQCAGEEIDARSDLYTMGIIMYEMITGTLPFVSKTSQGYLAQHMVAPPRPIREIRPDLALPLQVEAVLMRALAKKPEERYQNANQFIEALVDCAKECNIPVTIEGGGTVVIHKSVWKVLIPVITLLVAATIIFFVYFRGSGEVIDPERQAFYEQVAQYKLAKNWNEAKKTLDDASYEKFRADQDWTTHSVEVDAGIQARDERFDGQWLSLQQRWIKVDDQNEHEEYDPLRNEARDIAAKDEEYQFTDQKGKLEAFAGQVEKTRNADAKRRADRIMKEAKRINEELTDNPGAIRYLSENWPDKFRYTPSNQDVEAYKGKLLEFKPSEAELKAKAALENADKFSENFKEKYAERIKSYNDVFEKYKGTKNAIEARGRADAVKLEWEAAALAHWGKLKPMVEEAKNKGDFAKALTLFTDHAMPQDMEESTKAGRELSGERSAIRSLANQKYFDEVVPFVKNELLPAEKGGQVQAAIDKLKTWTEFPDSTIQSDAQARSNTYARFVSWHAASHMVLVAECQPTIGSDKYPDAKPPHKVAKALPAFYVDVNEVTNAEYFMYCEENQVPAEQRPSHWVNGQVPQGLEKHPVVNVSQLEAKRFAEWCGKRLLSEVEWEVAARGAAGDRDYPWGNEFPQGANNLCNYWFKKDGPGPYTQPVGSFPDGKAKESGCSDMAGNVAEWTDTDWDLSPGSTKKDPDAGKLTHMVIRGGSFDNNDSKFTKKVATFVRLKARPGDTRQKDLGFRCAKDVAPK